MIHINIHEAKTHLSRYLKRVMKGESVILCNRNTPVAEIRPLPKPVTEPRPLGLGKGLVEIGDEFFEPLPEEIIRAFEGGGE
jgi:prevent-host-death family protein